MKNGDYIICIGDDYDDCFTINKKYQVFEDGNEFYAIDDFGDENYLYIDYHETNEMFYENFKIVKNKKDIMHESVLNLLFNDIIDNDLANKLHKIIDEKELGNEEL